MHLARIRTDTGVIAAARVGEDGLLPLDGIGGKAGSDLIRILDEVGVGRLRDFIAQRVADGAALIPEDEAVFELPVQAPEKLVGVSLNYAAHAAEGDHPVPAAPVLFFLPPSSLLPHRGTVVLPAESARVDYEVELAIVIGRACRNLPADRWREVVAGFTIVNDVTARDLQIEAIARNQPWDITKAYDTFSPCGPYLVPAADVAEPNDLALSLRIGDRVLQQGNTSQMVFRVPRLIEQLSAAVTLKPGDIIATGTPSGIGPVHDGEVMEATVEGLGTLVNPAVAA